MEPTSIDLLRAFLPSWPAGSHLTTRAIQVMAGLPSLDDVIEAMERLSAEGLVEMERVGATRLWYPRAARDLERDAALVEGQAADRQPACVAGQA